MLRASAEKKPIYSTSLVGGQQVKQLTEHEQKYPAPNKELLHHS